MQHANIARPARAASPARPACAAPPFARRAADTAEHPFDAEKILFRHSFGQRAEKRAVAATKIDMQRRGAAKDFWKIEAGDVRFRDQFDHGKELCLRRSNAT